jgi:hypothetical protein
MPGSSFLRGLALAVVLSGLAWPASAQSDDDERGAGYDAIIDSIDLLVDNYATRLARKYDLTEEQNAYTKSLLRERSYEFLDKHEPELRSLVNRLFEVRMGGEMTPEELVEWGQRTRPVYEEAKRLVVDGNNEWREILTPEQKKIHDEDLKLMYQSFETTEEQLTQIASGEMTVEQFRSPQRSHRRPTRPRPNRPPPSRREPPALEEPPPPDEPPPPPPGEPTRLSPVERSRTAEPRSPKPGDRATPSRVTRHEPAGKPPGRQLTRPETAEPGAPERRESRRAEVPGKAGRTEPEGAWEKYVREFIERYKLNDEQAQKAHTVLEDCASQRDRYLRGNKEQIEQVEKQIEELKKSKNKNKAKSLAALTERRNKLTAPIDQIFEQRLKPRLERLPTRAQRRAAEAATRKPATKKPPKAEEEKKDSRGRKDD